MKLSKYFTLEEFIRSNTAERMGISTRPMTGQPPVKNSFQTSPGMTVRSRPRKL